ncbi:histidine kinase dimerization/phospho-acceptor domain-containing protein, partial [Clostridium sp.]|uniref:histidine kinase dimerization/phospho-acceptor domain-containing protein n=1 Tax=Clostridium sp. TaxID=1506 RepID=UPI0028524C8F
MVYTFDNTQNRFIPAELFSGLFTSPTKMIKHIYCDNQNILWCIVSNNTVNEIQEIIIENSRKTIKNYPYFQMMIDMTGSNVFAFFSYTLENKEKVLWGGEGNILAKYNIAARSIFSNTNLFLPLMRRVYIYGNKIIYNGFEKNIPGNYKELHTVDYSNNLVGFEFASPDYLKENENEYQYKLVGFDKVWSSWGKETKKEYTNLSAGKYYFLVHSRNAKGEVSGEAVYGFEIILPWYMTWWAKLAVLLILILIINYLIKIRLRYLKEKTVLLERTVAERTQKIIEQKETLEEQAKTLLELNRAKSNLFANISHEFRTPLTLIKGQLENLMEIEHDEAVKKKIKVAYSNSKRLHSLINQILDLSKMDSWKVRLKLGSIDLVPVVLGRAASFELLAKEKGIELKVASNVKSLPVRIDKEKFEKVIDNLLSNAFKFTSRGGTVSV